MQIARTWTALPWVALLAVGAAWTQEGKGQEEARRAQKGGEKGDRTVPVTKIGQAAPDFTLLDCYGKKHKLSDYTDKIVVLEWVNQQCPWSLKAVSYMKELHKKYDQKGIVWLGVESTHSRKPEENVQYIKDKELDFPILMDTDGRVGRMYGAKTTPHVFLIDKDKLVYRGGLHNNQHGDKKAGEVRNYLDEALAAVLAGDDVPVAETTSWGCSIKYKGADAQPGAQKGRKAGSQEEKEK